MSVCADAVTCLPISWGTVTRLIETTCPETVAHATYAEHKCNANTQTPCCHNFNVEDPPPNGIVRCACAAVKGRGAGAPNKHEPSSKPCRRTWSELRPCCCCCCSCLFDTSTTTMPTPSNPLLPEGNPPRQACSACCVGVKQKMGRGGVGWH